MLSRSARYFVVVTLAGSAVFFTAGCPAPAPAPAQLASIIARLSGSNTLESDGVSKLTIAFTALNKSNKPDVNPITVTQPTGAGFLAPKDDTAVPGDTLTGTPSAQGELDVDFRCTTETTATVALTATNGDASTNVTIKCAAPGGPVIIAIAQNDCSNIEATGFSGCNIALDVHQLGPGNAKIPFVDIVNITADAVATAGGSKVDDVLAAKDAISGGQPTEALSPGTDGLYTFAVVAPSVAEDVTVHVSAGGSTTDIPVSIGTFTDDTAVSVTSSASHIVGGNAASKATITVAAIKFDGTAATATDVLSTVTVDLDGAVLTNTSTGDTSDASGTLTNVALDDTGSATFTVTAPSEQTVETLTVSATFQANTQAAL
ncbi:MAG TPA: hypothetical protein VGO62_15040, partial [Myxococcota bacterium]